MFVFLAAIAAFVFAAGQDDGPRDIYARVGVPKMETNFEVSQRPAGSVVDSD